jgi:histidyl-tRNA synthetase
LSAGTGYDLLSKLEADEKLTAVVSAKEGLVDMRKLFDYLEVFGVLDRVCVAESNLQPS